MGRLRLLGRFLLAAIVLAVLLVLFGPRTLVATLRGFSPVTGVFVALLATTWLALRAEALYQTVRVSIPGTSRRTCGMAFFAGVFVASVLPVGNVGGVVSAGFVLSDREGTTGSQAVGIISAWEVLNMIASVTVAVVGVLVILLPGGRVDARVLAVLGIVGAAGLVTIALLRFRRRWITTLSWHAAGGVHRLVQLLVPSRADRFAPPILAARGRRFARGFAALTDKPMVLGRTIVVLMVAWSALGAALFASFVALGSSLAPGVALLVPQIGGLAGVIPLPGGLGSIDATLVGLLLSFTGEGLVTVGAAVVVFRLATYWWGLLLSTLVVAGFGVRIRAFE